MSFTEQQVEWLKAPLDRSVVKEREQAGRKLSYIEAWQAIAEANRIFGFDAWHRETVEMRQLGEVRCVQDKYGKEQFRVGYMSKVRIIVFPLSDDGGFQHSTIVREGTGFGSGFDKDPDQAHESAIKEAESDAMKRALMTFGNPFGLALYDKTQANVADAPKVKTPTVDVHEDGPDWWGAEGYGMTAAKAKSGGWGETLDGWLGAIPMIPTMAEWQTWCRLHDEDVKALPVGWRKIIRAAVDERKAEL